MYKYYDANQKTKKAGDCVIRAIALATEQSWEKVYSDLCAIGIKKHRMPNDKVVWGEYLKRLGYEKHSEPRDGNGKRMSINRALKYITNKDVLIINAGNLHVTCVKNGIVYDTWDCSKKIMHSYWRKK